MGVIEATEVQYLKIQGIRSRTSHIYCGGSNAHYSMGGEIGNSVDEGRAAGSDSWIIDLKRTSGIVCCCRKIMESESGRSNHYGTGGWVQEEKNV